MVITKSGIRTIIQRRKDIFGKISLEFHAKLDPYRKPEFLCRVNEKKFCMIGLIFKGEGRKERL